TTTTGGTGTLDPNGYTVTVDGATKSIATNGSVTFNALTAGDHSVGLTDVASNCVVSGQNPRTINVPAGGTPQTNFTITCSAPANQPPTARSPRAATSSTAASPAPAAIRTGRSRVSSGTSGTA